jgi:hypothetical protein
MAKSFAGLGAAGGAIWSYATADPVVWAMVVAYGLLGATAGGLAGAALYITIRVLEFALKVGAVVLVAIVVLHLLGAVDMFRALAPVTHWAGKFF